MEVGPQAVWLSETLLGPLLGTKSVLCKCHRYKSPSGIRLPQESDCWAEIREAPLLLRGSEGKAEAKWVPGAAYEEGPFWKSQVGKGVALFGVLIFQFPGAKGILGPFSCPERPRGNSSNLASDSPSPVPGERSDSRGAFQGPPHERLPALASSVSTPCWGKAGHPGRC